MIKALMAHTPPRQDPYHAYHAYHALFPGASPMAFRYPAHLSAHSALSARIFRRTADRSPSPPDPFIAFIAFCTLFCSSTNLSSFAVSSQGKGQQLTWIVLPPNGDHNILLSIAHVGHG